MYKHAQRDCAGVVYPSDLHTRVYLNKGIRKAKKGKKEMRVTCNAILIQSLSNRLISFAERLDRL